MGQKTISGHDFDALSANRDNPTAVLVLEDGTIFTGFGFGATTTNVGEVCFNTSMTGYQEIITIAPDDALQDGGGNAKALTAPFTPPGVVFQGSSHGNISDAGAGNGTTTGTLLVGEKVEYQATFTLDQATIDSGQIRNCFSAQAIVKSTGANVNDSLDTCVDTTIPHVPVIEVTKIASVDDVNNSSTNDVGDIITYDI